MKTTIYLMFVLFLMSVTGCGDDDTVIPEEEIGTIIINQTPDTLAGTGWTLTGPQNEAGSSDTTLTDMPTGSYTITWAAVSGYATPSSDTKTMAADGTITFTGIYTADPDSSFVLIPAGNFMMGSPVNEPDRFSYETQHSVTLTKSFHMFATEVTNRQYVDMAQWAYNNGYCTATSTSLRDNLDGNTNELLDLDDAYCEISFIGSAFTVDAGMEEHPVKEVTWYGAVAYCDWLSLSEGLPRAYNHLTWQCNGHEPYNAQGYRLPTEAEWEYACRAGTQTPFNTGSCLDAGTEANCDGRFIYASCPSGSYVGWTVPVESYPANGYSLYDMHGNLWEWCNDWYGEYDGSVTDPEGPVTGSYRVVRGGGWSAYAQGCRSASRYSGAPGNSYGLIVFRPVRSVF